MDCHDFARAKSRNDDKKVDSSTATILKQSAQDSRILELESAFGVASSQAQARLDSRNEAQNLKTPAQDSRICDEKSGLCERVQGRILSVCNCSTREAIYDLSRKAESSKQQLMPLIARVS